MKKKEPIGYYTDQKVDVTRRIKEGDTFFYTDRKEAQERADQQRSYVYEVFDGQDQDARLIGFAVPK